MDGWIDILRAYLCFTASSVFFDWTVIRWQKTQTVNALRNTFGMDCNLNTTSETTALLEHTVHLHRCGLQEMSICLQNVQNNAKETHCSASYLQSVLSLHVQHTIILSSSLKVVKAKFLHQCWWRMHLWKQINLVNNSRKRHGAHMRRWDIIVFLHLRNLFYEYIFLFCSRELVFVNICIFFVHVNWVSRMWIGIRMPASCLLRELLMRSVRFHMHLCG